MTRPISDDELPGAWTIAAAVRRGELTAEVITTAALQRIAGQDRGAWLRVDAAAALTSARAIDAARSRGAPLGPLAGVPAGLKDSFVTAGLATTAGSAMLRGWVPLEDGEQARRLRAAGAIILGKLALDEFAMGSSCERSSAGPLHNPWARGFVPGGSSGGSAVAVAMGTACVALGSDTGGSIRQPAALCGVVGLRPTQGRVSRRGLIAFASSLDQAGPITRDVRDAALVLGCLSGHDPGDSSSATLAVPDYVAAVEAGRDGVAGLRVGVDRAALVGVEDAVMAAFTAALGVLRAAGATIVEVELPHAAHGLATYHAIASAEALSNLARYDGLRYGPRELAAEDPAVVRAAGFGVEVQRRLLLGAHVLRGSLYEHASRVRTLIARDHAAAWARCDVLAGPTTAEPAFRIGERIDDRTSMARSDRLLVGASLAGLPAISVPAGFCPATGDRPRLPVGLHLVAPAFTEPLLLRVAAAHEARTSWHRARPPEGA